MKKSILSFFLIVCPLFLTAQDIYKDVLAEGKTWEFIRWPSGNTHQEVMRGDTIVNGITCKKYGYVNGDGTFACTAIFRQDGDKVYSLNFNTGEFYLAYDFGAKVGDVITIGQARIEVTGTDVVTARGHELRRVSFKVTEANDGNGWAEVVGDYGSSWIEGIGGGTGPVSKIPVPGLTGNYDMMLDISFGDEIICDSYIFQGQGYEKTMVSYKPMWTYNKQVWDEDKGEWRESVECNAIKTGMELPAPQNFPYAAVTIEEEESCRLLLRNGGMGLVLAEKASYLDYISKAFPEMDDVFTELAYYPLDVVLYDFTLEAGDRYPCKGEVYVSRVSHMTTRDSVERKVLFLSNGLEIVEGIGCLNSPDGPFAYQNSSGFEPMSVVGPEQDNRDALTVSLLSLRKYGEGTDPIYVKGDELAYIRQNSITNSYNSELYDLTGRRIASPPSHGVYIRDGRKYLR